jgi:hypothetical protein
MDARRLTPELLDALPPDAVEARASRRDLWRLNALMRHRGEMIRWWWRQFPDGPPRRIADLGAGDARLTASVLQTAFPGGGADGEVLLIDRQPCVEEATREALRGAGWQARIIAANVFDGLTDAPPCDAIMANLFLHHFDDGDLARLLALCAEKTERFCSLEPARTPWSALACRTLRLIGCGAVTRHDARVSVEAGFRVGELSTLWPRDERWRLREQWLVPFGHAFEAIRTPAA